MVDFTSSESIARWLAIAPVRHRAYLRGLWRIWPQFREAMEAGVLLHKVGMA